MYNKSELIELLKNDALNEEIFSLADKTRKEFVGDSVHLRGLIEFSNFCRCACKYCGINVLNKNAQRYRMTPSEIVSNAKSAIEAGYKTIVLQSGEDIYYTKDKLCEIISEIKKFDVALTLSIGERSKEDYRAFRECGADRYLIRIETTDENLYKNMHPNMDFKNRLKCLYDLKELGYEVGTGCLVGLPGQSIESLADDILFFKEIDADMIGIGPYICHNETPLKGSKNGSLTLALKVMALTRIMLKDINIPATTAMETLRTNGKTLALQAGANVIMPNVTSDVYSSKYEIYPNKKHGNDNIIKERKEVEDYLNSIQRRVSDQKGYRKF